MFALHCGAKSDLCAFPDTDIVFPVLDYDYRSRCTGSCYSGPTCRGEEQIYRQKPEDFSSVREKLEEQGLEFLEAEVQMVPTTYTSLDENGVAKMQRFLDMLDDLDDVTNVYHNWDE